ncbi:PREDICTED: uncharacterized protein LOC108774503 [Cyphomyrmex costatus]|uniref:uncharacterized protein LOC108774503 n=1 Tax=Cyphomyrmex costatus TaxID=456900 RepID=UPI0008523C49|nr:PREDICTED: uncharacterized protein LOC108774503 [Cyphomyrmex costatus]
MFMTPKDFENAKVSSLISLESSGDDVRMVCVFVECNTSELFGAHRSIDGTTAAGILPQPEGEAQSAQRKASLDDPATTRGSSTCIDFQPEGVRRHLRHHSVAGVTRKAESKLQPNAKRSLSCAATVKVKCHFCQGDHAIYYWKTFVALPVPQRAVEIRSRKLCVNCLRSSSHVSSKCTSGQCKVCHAKHHTLLHASSAAEASTDKEDATKPTASSSVLAMHSSSSIVSEHVMLSTAVVHVCDNEGTLRPCRALLDCGSQANFISKKFVELLGLKTRPLNISISGVNGTIAISHYVVTIKLQLRVSSYAAVIECIVSDQVTDKIPPISTERGKFDFPRNIRLADPRFHISSDIDLLIGGEIFWDLICVGQIRSSDKHPTLQKTRLGWILSDRLGTTAAVPAKVHSFHASVTNSELHDHISRAWQMDNISIPSNNYTIEENICERHFLDNTSQDSQGRYIVKLPVKEQMLEKIGDSRETALKRLREIEKRFKRNPALKIRYTEFIEEYKSLGHMRRLEPPIAKEPTSFYLPHHCVFKAVGQTSKIRVVFDASCRSSSGVSLNDALLVGPNVQRDLVSILLRFRFFSCVITADITKIYRQISMHPSQTRLQRILWRNDSSMNVDTYELTTVTYGTASASFLATRCLKHLADQHTHQFPRGSACVLRDFYVDDMLTGADSIDELKLIRDKTIQLLRAGMFELNKWASNCPELLETDKRGRKPVAITHNITDFCILGMQWNHCQDTFQFSCEPDSEIGIVSKRLMLSKVSKYFDPLGLLGPVIVVAKLILQDLWQLDIQWDESVPQEIHTRWVTFKTQMKALNQLAIPRCVKSNIYPLVLEIHGFCDVSQRAFGACIYLRTKLGHNEYRSTLLCSRSRVAPLKAISLP